MRAVKGFMKMIGDKPVTEVSVRAGSVTPSVSAPTADSGQPWLNTMGWCASIAIN
jgi:hypothetical protein